MAIEHLDNSGAVNSRFYFVSILDLYGKDFAYPVVVSSFA